MKRSIVLIILFALSLGSSIAQLFRLSRNIDLREEEVSHTLKTLYHSLGDNPLLENIPDWIGIGVIESARHFQNFGMTYYDLKTGVYYLTILAVCLMFMQKKIGFWIYLSAQLLAVFALLYALGITSASLLAATLTLAMSILFITLYKKLFYNKLKD